MPRCRYRRAHAVTRDSVGTARVARLCPPYELPPLGKKLPQQARCLAFADAAVDLGPVVAGRGDEKFHAVLDRAALGIGGAEIEPADTRERDRGGAHGA